MIRTVVFLEDEDKRWLDGRAAREGVPMTELVRRAVRMLRRQGPRERPAFDELLERTAGVGSHGDGRKHQAKLRREW